MRISELLKRDGVTFSLEVFPPKTSEKYSETAAKAMEIARLKPDFMSVTYGAGGGTGEFTTGIAADIQNTYGVPTLAHLTCVSSTRAHVLKMLDLYRENGIENILALRGDIPKDGKVSEDYRYAVELIRDIREHGDFCLGGACYPEGHIESPHKSDDLRRLKEKTDAGLDFLTTQMFFSNDIFYNFLYRAREAGINVPVIAGIMPITSPKQLGRSVAMNGRAAALPRDRGLLRRESACHAAGRHRLCHGADHRPAGQRHPAYPRLHDEQAGGRRRHHEEPE